MFESLTAMFKPPKDLKTLVEERVATAEKLKEELRVKKELITRMNNANVTIQESSKEIGQINARLNKSKVTYYALGVGAFLILLVLILGRCG
jgi:hypothetical protein